ncbi:molecular chaperones HSP70/HSC70, HSP70 superfamily [Tribonema minus]|uniref:Molecular chaperones HSP70/HSC70, HSP70 superfamily n=1 Tax=Tribonema minus TaxID=303371 RepID=A0A836CLV9_9STRA|nr:molecular chaperones HSP70/HSC70, HSP70 superfamily [Tribonema minus]
MASIVDQATAGVEGLSVNGSKQQREVVIGIDLGTTYSCVACWDAAAGRPVVLPAATGEKTVPSYVAYTPQARVVGQPAKSQAPSNPANTVYDVKRIIGRSWNDDVVQAERKNFPFKVIDGGNERPTIEVEWRGETHKFMPEEVSATILTELKRQAERALGRTVKAAVITVPAHFNDQQRQATKDAGRIAGLDVRRIINEPTAAALAYGLHNSSQGDSGARSNVVIFDLGGGTFDVSVLSMDGGVFEVKATGGDTHLGGEDFDNALVDWAVAQFEAGAAGGSKESAKRLRASTRAMRRLQTACETAKRALSTAPSVQLDVDSLIDDTDLSVTVTRERFEELNAPLFTRCMDTVRNVLADAKVSFDEVSDVVLVGGSTRVPALQDQLRALFGGRMELCRSINPDEAVAIGAAVQGQILCSGGSGGGVDLGAGFVTDIVLLDVTPLSLGIELEGREMSTLIKRNTAIPCRKSRVYSTVEDYQTSIDVVVYEGERRSVDGNHKLGDFQITGVERAKKGEPKVEVTFTLDANGILNVTARDQVTGAEAGAQIAARDGRLSEEEVQRMIDEAERFRAQDEEFSLKLRLTSSLEEAVYRGLSVARERKDIMAVSELDELRDWLDEQSQAASLAKLQEKAAMLKTKFNIDVHVRASTEDE